MPSCQGEADGITELLPVPHTELVDPGEGQGLHDTGHVWAGVKCLSHSLSPSARPPPWLFWTRDGGTQTHHTTPPDPLSQVPGGGRHQCRRSPSLGWRWSSLCGKASAVEVRSRGVPGPLGRALCGRHCVCSLSRLKRMFVPAPVTGAGGVCGFWESGSGAHCGWMEPPQGNLDDSSPTKMTAELLTGAHPVVSFVWVPPHPFSFCHFTSQPKCFHVHLSVQACTHACVQASMNA